jgi:mRNA-degrading endonuclease RelE of RelBE toxin-antitoxin system
MFELIFSEKINNDIISSIKYIKDILKTPMAASNHFEELKKKYMLIYKINEENETVLLYRFMYCRRDWMTILTNDLKKG